MGTPAKFTQRLDLLVKFLIESGANVNQVVENRYHPLMLAVAHNKTYAAKMLLAAGANVNYKAENGKTVWELAQSDMHLKAHVKPEMFQILCEAGGEGIEEPKPEVAPAPPPEGCCTLM